MPKKPLPKFMSDYLSARGVDKKAAKKRSLTPLTTAETKREFGKPWPAFRIPYYTPDGEEILNKTQPFARARVFPDKAKGFSKQLKKPAKFLQRYGTKNHIYLDPAVKNWQKICEDTSIPIVITEGEVKAMCATEHGIVCVAIGGVWSWFSKIDGVSVPLTEFDWFEWLGRVVEIAYDADADINEKVEGAMKAISAELIRRGAVVSQVPIPRIDGDENTGLDDFLIVKGADAFYNLERDDALNPIIIELNAKHAVVPMGGKTLVMTETLDPNFPDREMLTFSSVLDMGPRYSNRKVTVNDKPISVFRYWMEHPARREYDGIVFSPDKEVEGYYNLWKGFTVEPKKGNCKLYKQHILENIARGDQDIYNYVWGWMADAVQNPSERTGTAIVLRGKQGVGKGVLVNIFGSLFGQHYIQVADPKHLLGNFNAHLKDKLIVFADEAFWAGDKASEGVLKRMITEPTLSIEAKFQDTIEIVNHMRLMVASNSDWVVPASLEERRFCILDVGEEHKQDRPYFQAINKQMDKGGRESLLYELMKFDLSSINLGVIPKTEALLDNKIHSMDSISQFWYYKMEEGDLLSNLTGGWGEGSVLCTALQDQYIEFSKESGFNRRSSPTEFGIRLKKLCPKMQKKRVADKATGARHYHYYFPSLSECRNAMNNIMGCVCDWDSKEF